MKEEIVKSMVQLTEDDKAEIERLTEIYYPKQTIDWDIGIQAHVNFLRDTVKTGVSIGYAAAKYGRPKPVKIYQNENLAKPEICGCLDFAEKEFCDGRCHT